MKKSIGNDIQNPVREAKNAQRASLAASGGIGVPCSTLARADGRELPSPLSFSSGLVSARAPRFELHTHFVQTCSIFFDQFFLCSERELAML